MTTVGVPPAADTRESVEPYVGVKRIVSSRLQLPGRGIAASQIGTGGPPDASILFSFPPAMNASALLSGDQNGAVAPSVPASGCAVRLSMERTHNSLRPLSSGAANARRRPSGDIARTEAAKSTWGSSRPGTNIRYTGGPLAGRLKYSAAGQASATVLRNSRPAASCHARPRGVGDGVVLPRVSAACASSDANAKPKSSVD